MDSIWYERRRVALADGEVDGGGIGAKPVERGAIATNSRASTAKHTLPSVRVSWQGLIASTNICVDTFTSSCLHQYQSSGLHQAADLNFFLTHMHADHTSGLTPSWNIGTIYTSRLSKTLLHAKFGVADEFVVGLPLHRPQQMYANRLGTERMWVTLIDASTHCPGAVMMLFEGYFGRILYTGDIRFDQKCEENFRWFAARYEQLKADEEKRGHVLQRGVKRPPIKSDNPKHGSGLDWLLDNTGTTVATSPIDSDIHMDPSECISLSSEIPSRSASGLLGTIDTLYLDNTFCHPRYANFHTTATVLPAMKSVVDAHSACDILLGGDTLGKEDLLVLLSHSVQSKIVVPESRWRLLQTMAEAGVHLNTSVSLQDIKAIVTRTSDPNTMDTGADNPGAASSTVSASAGTAVEPFVNPLTSPRDWMSCFSLNPNDGFIKFGPKKQVNTANIEWMNRMVRTHTRRKERTARGGGRRKRRKTASPNEPNCAKPNSDQPAPMDISPSVIAVDSSVGEMKENDEADEEADEESDDDSDHSTSDSDSQDDAVDSSSNSLERPVVGIIVSGWAVDRQPGSVAPVGVTASSVADSAAPSAPSGHDFDPTKSCRGPAPGNCKIHCLPYSSHSSYAELRRFVGLVHPNVIRPLCKGDCNTAVLDDLLTPQAELKPIVVPQSMTRPTLNPISNNVLTTAQKRRMDAQTKALEKAIQQSTNSFSSLACSLGTATARGKQVSSRPRAAMVIGADTQEEESEPDPYRPNTTSANGATVVLDSTQHVDLTSSLPASLPASLPPLEDAFGVKYEGDNRVNEVDVASSDPDCKVLSTRVAPLSLPRVRTWLDLFAVFEHYPHVPIEGFVVPPPSDAHIQSYAYTQHQSEVRAQQEREKLTEGPTRRLPRFLKRQDVDSMMDEMVSRAMVVEVQPLPTVSVPPVEEASVILMNASSTVASETSEDVPRFRFDRDGSCSEVRLPQTKVETKAAGFSCQRDSISASNRIQPKHESSSSALLIVQQPHPQIRKRKKKEPSLPSYMMATSIGPRPLHTTKIEPAQRQVNDLTETPPNSAQKNLPRSRPRSILHIDCSQTIELLSSLSQD